jgi:hypothetical protein
MMAAFTVRRLNIGCTSDEVTPVHIYDGVAVL